MYSLKTRLALAACVVLAVFLGLTALALERAFRDSALAAAQERLQAHVYGLLAAAELEPDAGLVMPDRLPEARYATPGSGLYAVVRAADGEILWRSQSLLGLDVELPVPEVPGEAVFARVRANDARPLHALAFAVDWETGADGSRRLVFQVAESERRFTAELQRFRRSLWVSFAAAGIVLLLVQGLILRAGLAPLGRAVRELAEIRAGRKQRLSARHPRELQPLTEGLNALIEANRERLDRYRRSLAELAHSLKTPLAVLQSTAEGDAQAAELRRTVTEQAARMRRTIDYQLQRAAASGHAPLAPPVQIGDVSRGLRDSLLKVYADKDPVIDLEVDDDCRFAGDEGDLQEILGNLLDNACKWCRRRVRLSAGGTAEPEGGVALCVEDDGPGIPQARARHLIEHGARGDPATPGHGIGLAVVHQLVTEVYGGTLEIDRSPLGGARVRVALRGGGDGNERWPRA